MGFVQQESGKAEAIEAPAEGAARSLPPYAVFVLGMLLGAYTINWFDRNLLIISMEAIKQDLALSDTSLGLVTGIAFSGVYTVSGITLARWSDIGSRRSVIAGGLALWSVATAFCGLARNTAMLFAGRFFVGLGESACSPPAHSLIADYFKPGQRATALAVYGLGEYLGLGLGLGVGGWLVDAFGWRTAFSVAAVPGLAMAVLFRLTVREPPRGLSAPAGADDRHYTLREVIRFMLGRRSFVAYVIGTGLFVFAGDTTDIWGATFLIRIHGYSDAEVGETIGLLGSIAGVVGTLFFAILADRLSARDPRWYLWVAAGGGAIMLPISFAFLWVEGQSVFLCYFLATFFGASYMAPTVAITQRLMPPRMRALSSAVILFSFNILGLALGNLATGVVSDALTPQYGVEALRYALVATLLAGIAGFVLTMHGAQKLPDDLRAAGGAS